jgi:cell filamentation protein
MILKDKLNSTDQGALVKAEEKISKQKAKKLFDSGDMYKVEISTFDGLFENNVSEYYESYSAFKTSAL